MQAGNAHYRVVTELPASLPVFPLAGALLLPGGRMPLNIFEPRYLQMVDAVLAAGRLIGMIQPMFDGALLADGEPRLCAVGCMGRLTSFAETGDGRYLISLQGVCRFRVAAELDVKTPFRQCRALPFAADLSEDPSAAEVDRPAVLRAFRAYLDANDLKADWDGVGRLDSGMLVNTLSMMAPYGAAEKQALLEAPDLKSRAEALVAMTEIALAKTRDDFSSRLQ